MMDQAELSVGLRRMLNEFIVPTPLVQCLMILIQSGDGEMMLAILPNDKCFQNLTRSKLIIDTMKGSYEGELTERDWVIRFHLPLNLQPEKILVNGKIPDTNSVKQKIILPDDAQHIKMPFMGEGSQACATNGSIFEIAFKKQTTRKPVRISFELK